MRNDEGEKNTGVVCLFLFCLFVCFLFVCFFFLQ